MRIIDRRDIPWLMAAVLLVALFAVFQWARSEARKGLIARIYFDQALFARHYANSGLLDVLLNTPDSMTIYTNSVPCVHFWVNRKTKPLPFFSDKMPDFAMTTMADVKYWGGLLIWFGADSFYMPPDSFLKLAMPDSIWVDTAVYSPGVAIKIPGRRRY